MDLISICWWRPTRAKSARGTAKTNRRNIFLLKSSNILLTHIYFFLKITKQALLPSIWNIHNVSIWVFFSSRVKVKKHFKAVHKQYASKIPIEDVKHRKSWWFCNLGNISVMFVLSLQDRKALQLFYSQWSGFIFLFLEEVLHMWNTSHWNKSTGR